MSLLHGVTIAVDSSDDGTELDMSLSAGALFAVSSATNSCPLLLSPSDSITSISFTFTSDTVSVIKTSSICSRDWNHQLENKYMAIKYATGQHAWVRFNFQMDSSGRNNVTAVTKFSVNRVVNAGACTNAQTEIQVPITGNMQLTLSPLPNQGSNYAFITLTGGQFRIPQSSSGASLSIADGQVIDSTTFQGVTGSTLQTNPQVSGPEFASSFGSKLFAFRATDGSLYCYIRLGFWSSPNCVQSLTVYDGACSEDAIDAGSEHSLPPVAIPNRFNVALHLSASTQAAYPKRASAQIESRALPIFRSSA